MRIVQFKASSGIRVGAVVDGGVLDLDAAAKSLGLAAPYFRDITEFLRSGDRGMDAAERVISWTITQDSPNFHTEAAFASAVFPGKIVAIGLNYRDHAIETGAVIPSAPLCFAKFPSSITGPFDPIVLPDAEANVDFEGELGVVLGKTARNVRPSEAFEYVAGYVVVNDVSARKWQFEDGQWTRGKSCDTFAPNGPWLVTRDEVPDPQNLRIVTRVGDETLQDSNTSQMIFGVAELVSYLSRSFTLHPGDLIATGTPAGVGVFRKPPRFLRPGDIVQIEIEKIGTIRNTVVSAPE